MPVDSPSGRGQPFPFGSGDGRFGTASPAVVSNPNETTIKCPRCSSQNTKFCYYNNYSLSQPRHFCKDCRRYWTRGGTLRNVPIGGICRKKLKPKPSSSHHLAPIEESTVTPPMATTMPLSTPPCSSTTSHYMFFHEPSSSYLVPPVFSDVNLARNSIDAPPNHGHKDVPNLPMEFVHPGELPSYGSIHLQPPAQPFSLTLAGGLNNFSADVKIDPGIQWNQSSKHNKIDRELHWSQSTYHKKPHFDDTLAPNPAGELLSLMSEHDLCQKSFKQSEYSSSFHLKTSSNNGRPYCQEGGHQGLFDQHPPPSSAPWNNREWLDVSGYPLPNRPPNSSS